MFAKFRQRLKGWKTVVVNAMIGLPASLLFLYEQFGGVDVTPLAIWSRSPPSSAAVFWLW